MKLYFEKAKCKITESLNGFFLEIETDDEVEFTGMAYTDRGNLTSPQVEEYIRKDALLEWLQERKKYYQSLIPAYGAVAFICALDEVKYKINSL